MDGLIFDRLARAIGTAGTRRRLLAVLAALPLGGAVLSSDEAAAEHPNQHLGHRTQQRKRKQRNNKNNNKNTNGGGGGGAQPGPGSQACDVCPTCRYKDLLAALRDDKGPTTIRICPGTYYGPFAIRRALTLIGSGQGTGAGDTILKTQGAGSGSVITIQQSNPIKQPPVGPVTLQSLRITGGGGDRETEVALIGGGVNHQGTSLTMTDCTITDNHVGDPARNLGGQGGGLAITGLNNATATLTNCTISGNSVIGSQGLGGGGGIVNAGTLTLNNSSVTENASTGGSGGGGIGNAGTLVLNNSSVTGNTATGGYQNGGGILNLGGSVTVQNGSSVTGNTPDNCTGTPVPGCSG